MYECEICHKQVDWTETTNFWGKYICDECKMKEEEIMDLLDLKAIVKRRGSDWVKDKI